MANTKLAVGIAVGVSLALALAVASFVTSIGAGVPEAGLFLGVLALVLANLVLIVAAIVHALARDDLADVQRMVWVAIAFFVTPVVALGAIVYFALGRQRTRDLFRDLGGARPPPAPPASPPGP